MNVEKFIQGIYKERFNCEPNFIHFNDYAEAYDFVADVSDREILGDMSPVMFSAGNKSGNAATQLKEDIKKRDEIEACSDWNTCQAMRKRFEKIQDKFIQENGVVIEKFDTMGSGEFACPICGKSTRKYYMQKSVGSEQRLCIVCGTRKLLVDFYKKKDAASQN